jgi:carbonic anhydrase/acetyltransferase-like protein (isoleucine patch superfamily)
MPIYAHRGTRPTLGRDVYLAPTASVIGDVVLGEQASVWFGAVLRGDVYPIRIGNRTNVQDNAVIHVTGGKARTTIGDDVTIGHLALLHGCTVGNRCLIGMGSILLDDAVIEEECIVAAGALVPPRHHVPARSLYRGHPGKVVRTLRDADFEQIREAASLYVQYARTCATELNPI